jgi:hypothetical protein
MPSCQSLGLQAAARFSPAKSELTLSLKKCSLSIRPGGKRKGTSRIASRLETLPITLWSRVLQTNIILRTKGTITKINVATFFKKSKATKISG